MEYFDICDANGLPTGQTISRAEAHRAGIRHRTAHVYLTRWRDGRPQVLLQKRSRNKDSFPGFYDTSSAGHIPAGCAVEESALRELREELGITALENEIIPIGHFEIQYAQEFHGATFRDNEYANVFVLSREVDIQEIHIQEEELERVDWFYFDEVRKGVEEQDGRFCVPSKALDLLQAYFDKIHP